ncbi:olfactory receptor 52m1 [Lynx pardinus]|uniref:Olfactory receptor 52m1 n=1 Tax=Lynx pardinus TaxID=191816 RepID=A0A485MIZ2_LYNPA|nr:olfactory receptor 52m1 [Lynx pardinus]
MPPFNTSHPSVTFLLMGIPGLEHLHVWIGIPFCSMYVVAVVGNVSILAVVRAERSLHEPMFFFLCMLSVTDLVLSTSTLPRMLCLFWLGVHDIAFDVCLAQMFFIHSFTAMESGFFLAMAFDRYVAICHPLHHTTILTHARITIMSIIVFMAVVKLACMDIGATKSYSLSMASIIGSCDAILIAVSYAFILRSVFRLPSREASFKALGTCGSHVCVILVFYSTAGFSIFTHRFGKNVPAHVHIFIANMYLLVPPFLNPIVYGVRTKKIREHVIRTLMVKVA